MHTLEQLRRGELQGIQALKLSCGLTDFPREILELADTLEVLDLTGNALTQLPDELDRLHKLRILFCSDNAFTELPRVLGRCAALSMVGFKANRIRYVPAQSLPVELRWLILTDNAIETLPQEMGRCHRLQKLMLAGNRLSALPESLAQCRNLELIRLAANRLEALPSWLTTMPRLAWLAFAGNPIGAQRQAGVFDTEPDTERDLEIAWARLRFETRLGEGASGVIHRARLEADDGHRSDVAVKVFRSAVTSDGLPQCELAASLRAGRHPHLIPVLGRATGHPEGSQALVMGLIDASFRTLAAPPSLDSCTRDIHDASLRLRLNTVLRMAQGLAGAVRHLHDRGILHGDVYAHNTLHDASGQVLMGDFGAASMLPVDDPVTTARLQRLEVRAFGCLLEELLERCDEGGQASDVWGALQALKKACLDEDTRRRPLFRDIEVALLALQPQTQGQE